MRILVTGGTGFVGNHVINELLSRNIKVVVAGRYESKAKSFAWFSYVEFISFDISNEDIVLLSDIGEIDAVIHLAWSGLPNYKELFHLEKNLFQQYSFLKYLILNGISDILISGTCLEYGLKEGCLSVDELTDPQNPYAIAKDTLRRFLQQLQLSNKFTLKWVRLFYMYGEGQSPKSLIPQIQKAISEGQEVFNLSGGEQLRDYLPVEMVAEFLVKLSLKNKLDGIFNCCSGSPISVRTFVENYLLINEKNIKLNFGYYPYPDYEPFCFWGKKSILYD